MPVASLLAATLAVLGNIMTLLRVLEAMCKLWEERRVLLAKLRAGRRPRKGDEPPA